MSFVAVKKRKIARRKEANGSKHGLSVFMLLAVGTKYGYVFSGV
jgi:hypothetical protein